MEYTMNLHDKLIGDISAIEKQMQALHSQAVVEYTPIVENLIRSKCEDENRIELTLDYLLDFASDEQMLNLFRKLLRYYLPMNPQAVAEYIQLYRKNYDEDEKLFKSGYLG